MSLYSLFPTKQFRKDFKKFRHNKKACAVFSEVLKKLSEGIALEKKYQNHILKGEWNGFSECHVTPDTLLIYEKDEKEKHLVLIRIGSHSEIF